MALVYQILTEANSTAQQSVLRPGGALRTCVSSVVPTRERVLSAAASLFAEHGFASTSMLMIAKLSGITAAAIYYHFESKADLLLEVVRRALAEFSFEEDIALLPNFAAHLTDPALKVLNQLSLEVHVAARRDPEAHKLLAAYTEMMTQKIRTLVESTLPAGSCDATRDNEFTASVVMVLLTGLHHLDTQQPHLVGDRAWREFITTFVAKLLGLSEDSRYSRNKT